MSCCNAQHVGSFFIGCGAGERRGAAGVRRHCRRVASIVNHGFQEDLSLIQRLSHSATADQVVTAHSEFWQKAAEDYRKEFATVTKLLTKAAREASAASQTATGDCSAHALLAHQAA